MAIKIYSNITQTIQSHKALRVLSIIGVAVLYLGVGLGILGLFNSEEVRSSCDVASPYAAIYDVP